MYGGGSGGGGSGGGGGGDGGGGGVKYGFTSPPGPRLFLQALSPRTCTSLGACDVIRGATNTIIRMAKAGRRAAVRGVSWLVC